MYQNFSFLLCTTNFRGPPQRSESGLIFAKAGMTAGNIKGHSSDKISTDSPVLVQGKIMNFMLQSVN